MEKMTKANNKRRIFMALFHLLHSDFVQAQFDLVKTFDQQFSNFRFLCFLLLAVSMQFKTGSARVLACPARRLAWQLEITDKLTVQ